MCISTKCLPHACRVLRLKPIFCLAPTTTTTTTLRRLDAVAADRCSVFLSQEISDGQEDRIHGDDGDARSTSVMWDRADVAKLYRDDATSKKRLPQHRLDHCLSRVAAQRAAEELRALKGQGQSFNDHRHISSGSGSGCERLPLLLVRDRHSLNGIGIGITLAHDTGAAAALAYPLGVPAPPASVSGLVDQQKTHFRYGVDIVSLARMEGLLKRRPETFRRWLEPFGSPSSHQVLVNGVKQWTELGGRGGCSRRGPAVVPSAAVVECAALWGIRESLVKVVGEPSKHVAMRTSVELRESTDCLEGTGRIGSGVLPSFGSALRFHGELADKLTSSGRMQPPSSGGIATATSDPIGAFAAWVVEGFVVVAVVAPPI